MPTSQPPAPPPPDEAAADIRRREGPARSRDNGDAFERELDVGFGSHPRQHMDVYHPREPKGPVLVFLHGGGFRGGDPRGVGHFGQRYLEAGAIYVAMGYRLMPDALIEGSADDVEDGLTALAGRVAGWGGDPSRIYLSGHSAGAVLAAMVGLHPSPRLGADLVRGLVLISGVYHFEHRSDENVDRRAPRHVPNLIEHISRVPDRTIVVAGEHDFPAVMPDAQALTRALRARGGHAELHIEPDADHFQANRGFVSGSGPVFEATATMMRL